MTSKEVENLIGLSMGRVPSYCKSKVIFHQSYVIDDSEDESTKRLAKEWDKVRLEINPRAKR